MAKAHAICTCITCGSTFEKTADKRNRAECDSWEAWAVENFTECPTCYGRRMREAEKATPAYAEVTVTPYTKDFNVILRGNTYPFKDTAKQLGFRLMEEPVSGTFGMLSMKSPRKAWVYICKAEGLEEIIGKVSSSGLEIKCNIPEIDLVYMGFYKNPDET